MQAPLAAVLAQPEIRTPKDLEGERAGVTGLPSDEAVLRSVVQGAGGDPDKVKQTTIGFEAVKALLAGRVAGATAFWNVEGVALRAAAAWHPRVPRRPLRRARLSGAGAHGDARDAARTRRRSCGRRSARSSAATARRRATRRARSRRCSTSEPGLDRADARRPARRRRPEFTAGAAEFGQLRPAVLRAWAAWDARFGILEAPIDVSSAFDTTLVGEPDTP